MAEPNKNELVDWLVECALLERPIADTMREFARKLQNCGLPVDRINCSTFQRHQIMGAVDSTWEGETDTCETNFVPKSVIAQPNIVETPAGAMARSPSSYEKYNLAAADAQARFPIFKELHDRGYVDYILLKQSYGRQFNWLDTRPDSEGVYGSFATKNAGGFTRQQTEDIKFLWRPFSLFLKATTENMLSAKLLEAYVGTLPAEYVLSGMTERGDGKEINCVLFYSDLRGSTKLSAELPSEEYLELLNNYFDCIAGSVMACGGEVLKLIGDAVMAIFPIEGDKSADACAAAISAAQESLSMARKLQDNGNGSAASNFHFGIGLHIGEVILGNVGTNERLDMTVTGRSANQVTRVESLTKLLSLSVLASPQFYEIYSDNLVSIGKYPVPDLGGMTEIFSLVEN